MEFISKSEDETKQIAFNLAKKFNGGEVLLLDGDLGAGKTAFTKGIAEGLNIKSIITSPTFTILNQYVDGRLSLNHFDMYRIEDVSELHELGFDQIIGDHNSVTSVEWYQKTLELFDKIKTIKIQFIKLSDFERKIIIEGM